MTSLTVDPVSTDTTLDDSPAIWVGSLHAYSCGRLHGRWIKLDGMDIDELWEQVNEIVRTGGNPGGDWAIMDYDGFGSLATSLGENPNLENLLKLAELFNEHGPELVQAAADVVSVEDAETLAEVIQDRYIGEYDSLEDLAEQLMEDSGDLEQIPERLRYYFDYKAYGRDLELNGDVNTTRIDGTLYCFWGN